MFINPSKMIKIGGGRGGAILGIIVLLLLTFNPVPVVHGQCFPPECYPTETPTPVPTNTPYYAPTNRLPISGTPTPLVQGDCPDYARDHDRELSLNWMQACSKCPTTGSSVITPIPHLPTISYGNFGTPVPTSAATPMPTGTAIPTNGALTVKANILNVLTSIPQEVMLERTFTNYSINIGHGGLAISGIPMKYGVHEIGHIDSDRFNGPSGSDGGIIRLGAGPYANGGIDVEVVESNIIGLPVGLYHYDQNTGVNYLIFDHLQQVTYTNINWEIKYNVTILGTNTYGSGVQAYSSYDGFSYNHSLSGAYTQITWFPGEVSMPDIGYCSDYVYADEEEEGDPLVGMPDIDIWQGQCLDFVPPFSWFRDSAGSYLFDVDLSFPGIGICPIWVELGDMELAGISIPMDILFLPAVMFIFGLLFKM